MCKKEDIVFSRGCVEKSIVCAGVPSAFAFVLNLDPGWQREAGSEQALVKESGGSSLLHSNTRKCLLCSFKSMMRVAKVLGYVWVGRRACVNLLWG